MIRRVRRGRSVARVLRALYEPADNGDADTGGARLIASWDGDPTALEPSVSAGRGRADTATLARILTLPVAACDRAAEQYVYHLVLRNAPDDRRLSDEEWAQVCTAAMDATGIAAHGDAAGCRWVAVRAAAEHVHVVATLAREDGRAPRLWEDYLQVARVAHEYERRFGLRSAAAAWRSA